jgi:copper chaperone CopZ
MQYQKCFLLIALLCSIQIKAQVTQVKLQASGLTCSMCSNSINKALQTIDYVDRVTANIKESSFDIRFKPSAIVNFDQLKKKVEDAGFFVAQMEATIVTNRIAISNDAHVDINGTMYHFLNTGDKVIEGEMHVRLLDKGFVSAKDFKRNARFTKMNCYQTGYMGSCCKKSAIASTRIYHVTI